MVKDFYFDMNEYLMRLEISPQSLPIAHKKITMLTNQLFLFFIVEGRLGIDYPTHSFLKEPAR